MKIAMIGTRYVGLVSRDCFSDFGHDDFGHDVVCIDKSPEKVPGRNKTRCQSMSRAFTCSISTSRQGPNLSEPFGRPNLELRRNPMT